MNRVSRAKQPTLRQLRCLYALYQELHFKKAADRCSISQAAFSIAIRNLERMLGADLIDRTNKQVVFTLLGNEIIEQARIILQEVDKLKEIADSDSGLLFSHLRIGVIPTIAPFILPALLPRIKKEWPKMRLLIQEDLTANLHESLLKGDLDLLLLALPLDLRGIETLSLFKDHFRLAYRKNTAMFAPPTYKESLLPDGSILLLKDGHCLRNHALSACSVKNANKVSSYTSSSLLTLVQMVESDLGITFIPELAIEGGMLMHTDIDTLAMPKSAYREIGFAWRKGSGQVDKFRQFAEVFLKLIGHEPS